MLTLPLRLAAKALHTGCVVAYPTEAVWGLGCDPENPEAVSRLLRLKRRSPAAGLILVAASIAQLEPLLGDLSRPMRKRLEESWPGPVTWLVPDVGAVPPWIRGVHDTVALRVTAHPVAAALCRFFGGPLVSTSANRSGGRPARRIFQVHRFLGGEVDCVVPGPLGGQPRPTAIRDLATGRAVRDA